MNKVNNINPSILHQQRFALYGSLCALFFFLFANVIIWAGIEAFAISTVILKISILVSALSFLTIWGIYILLKKSNFAIYNGLISTLILLSIFWTFGFAMFYFYFLFAPINLASRTIALTTQTFLLISRGRRTFLNIQEKFKQNRNIFDSIYVDVITSFELRCDSALLNKKLAKNHDPFVAIYFFLALATAPFVLSLNRLTTPILGDGHGVFITLAFFSAPICIWGIDIMVQVVTIRIFYPIRLHKLTGKPVLIKI